MFTCPARGQRSYRLYPAISNLAPLAREQGPPKPPLNSIANWTAYSTCSFHNRSGSFITELVSLNSGTRGNRSISCRKLAHLIKDTILVGHRLFRDLKKIMASPHRSVKSRCSALFMLVRHQLQVVIPDSEHSNGSVLS
ncbi:hypothetical protein BDN67DRAFT_174019 [Paxillus ammoniavirescens]|nr:hypothetical protein BDN67DRAFT_174019 [Paxillus ammoniavirescens]